MPSAERGPQDRGPPIAEQLWPASQTSLARGERGGGHWGNDRFELD